MTVDRNLACCGTSEIPARLSTALVQRYTIERQVGAGGMATVYLAHDRKQNRHVAVHEASPKTLRSV